MKRYNKKALIIEAEQIKSFIEYSHICNLSIGKCNALIDMR